MPPGFTAVLMAGLVALAGGELMEVDDSSWWQSCKSPVCSVAETQAEGLARLRVLSNYIKETMTLMGTVIASLDNEMVEVGQELRDIVGRRCHARGHTALITLVSNSNSAAQAESGNLEVISDNDDSWTFGSAITQESTSEWANEVDVESGSSSTTSHQPSSTSHSTLHSTSHSTSHRPSSTSHSTSHASQTQTAASSTGSWRGVSQYPSPSTSQSSSQHHGGDLQSSSTTTTTHGHGKTLHHRPSSTLKRYEAEESETVYVPPAVPGTEDWQGGQGGGRGGGQGGGRGGGQGGGRGGGQGGGRGGGQGGGRGGGGQGGGRGGGQGGGRGGGGQGGGRGGGQGRGHGWGKSHGGGQGLGQGQGQGGLVSLTLGSSGCRGVPVGSPHYVPGLDVWCASNCPAGNCPATHCVC